MLSRNPLQFTQPAPQNLPQSRQPICVQLSPSTSHENVDFHARQTQRALITLFAFLSESFELSSDAKHENHCRSWAEPFEERLYVDGDDRKRNSKTNFKTNKNVKAFLCRKLIIIMREDNLWRARWWMVRQGSGVGIGIEERGLDFRGRQCWNNEQFISSAQLALNVDNNFWL